MSLCYTLVQAQNIYKYNRHDLPDLNIKNKNELEDIFTLGNLTLTQENQEMGNKPFSYKRKIFANSSLKINQILSKKNKFSLEDVKERANFLFEKALQIWKNPLEEILEI